MAGLSRRALAAGQRLELRHSMIIAGMLAVLMGACMWASHRGAPPPIYVVILGLFGWPMFGIARILGRREERAYRD